MPHKKIEEEVMFAGPLLLAIVPIIRFIKGSPLMPGTWPYYHDYLAKNIIEEIGYGNVNLYHFILYAVSFITRYSGIIVPFFLGVISLYLLHVMIKDNDLKKYLFIVTISSPFFLYAFIYSSPLSLLVTLYLVYIFLLMKKSSLSYIFSFIISGFSIVDSIVTAIIAYFFDRKKASKYVYISLSANIVFLALFGKIEPLLTVGIFSNIVSEMGGIIGVGFFNIVLAIIGLIYRWKKNRIDVNWSILAMILLYVFFEKATVLYISMLLIYLSSYGFYYLEKRKWVIEAVKSLTIFTLICGLIFSGVSFIARSSSALPDKDIMNSLRWLKEKDVDNVFSGKDEAFWIMDISEKNVTCSYIKCNDTLYWNITKSRLLDSSYEIMKKNRISHIYITNHMKSRLWNESDEGLLFILSNTEAFNIIYSNKEAEIYMVNESYSPLSYFNNIANR